MVPVIVGLRKWSVSGIGAKVFAIALAVILLLCMLAVWSLEAGGHSLEVAIGNESTYIANRISASVDRGIYLKYHEMTLLCLGLVVRTALEGSNIAFDAMEDPYEYINQTDSEWTSVPINQISPFMQSLMDNNLSVNLTNRLVEHYVIEHGLDIYREILVTNKYGALVAMTSRSMDYMQRDDEWWQLTVENEFYIGDVSYDECVRMHGVPVCLSVYDYSGEFAGVMRGFIDLVAVAEEVGLFEPAYKTEDTRILTNDGSQIYSSRAFVFMDDLSEENYYSRSSEDSGYFIAEEGGRPRLFGYYYSTGYLDYPGHNWLVLVSYDSAEVMQPLSELRTSITLLALLLAAASVFVTHMFARSITSPLKRLTKAAVDMSHGNLDRRVEVDRKDEIGQLAQAFNGMAEELDDLYDDLEVKVATRTAELQVANKKLGILGSITRHDALNQLTVLRGWLSMAQETVKNEATRQYLHKVELASENVASYLN
ncbi:MAG: HAMP domain-containing protein, partial [Thermoplasmata archaeon]|nr:HAMP domain-containing protein [Thermoplasmata archaeon]